jgi:hypothetical protein
LLEYVYEKRSDDLVKLQVGDVLDLGLEIEVCEAPVAGHLVFVDKNGVHHFYEVHTRPNVEQRLEKGQLPEFNLRLKHLVVALNIEQLCFRSARSAVLLCCVSV